MLHTAVGKALAGIVLGGVVYGVIAIVKIVDEIMDACALPRKAGR